MLQYENYLNILPTDLAILYFYLFIFFFHFRSLTHNIPIEMCSFYRLVDKYHYGWSALISKICEKCIFQVLCSLGPIL